MKIKMLILGAVTVLAISAGAQDRIYKKNGLILNCKVGSVSDSAIVFKDEQGERTILTSSARAIRYEFGNVLPLNGAVARHYRDEAFIYHKFRSANKLNLSFEAFATTLQIGIEHFTDPTFHQSLSMGVGLGLGTNRLTPGYSNLGKVKLATRFAYNRYTSILRDVRFYYGATIQINVVQGGFATPFYSNRPEDIIVENRTVVGAGPLAGLQVMLSRDLGLSFSTAPLLIFNEPVRSERDVSMQANLGFTYYLSKR